MTATRHVPCQVLIIEDDPAILHMLDLLLQTVGYTTATATDGAVAVQYLQETAALPHVILLDLQLQGMDGREFRAVQRANPAWQAIPVILLSASRHVIAAQQELDVAAALPKPFDPPYLLELVAQFCA